MKIFFSSIYILILFSSNVSYPQEVSGFAQFQLRYFPLSPLDPRQEGTGFSLALQPELYYEIGDGYHSILFVPFFRYDQYDDERTHFDIRELFWLYYADDWELSVGFRKIFWGVTESQHLVDVINQTDFVENFSGEQKLGQPRFPVLIDTDNPAYESSAENKHLDFSVRYINTIGDFDFGLSYFIGTSRDPRFTLIEEPGTEPYIRLNYDQMNQVGLDVQFTKGSWLWKLESITRNTRDRRFYAFTFGYEYTFSNISNSGLDIGVLTEWLYDDRDQFYFPPNPFNNHIFAGSRLAFNDIQSTQLLAGFIFDYRGNGFYPSIEASRRFGESFIVNLEARGFYNTEEGDLLHFFRRDNYVQLEVNWYY
jgi:hypothetical protein